MTEPSVKDCEGAIEALRRNRAVIVRWMGEYPIICSIPGLTRVLTKESDIDDLIARLSARIEAAGGPSKPIQITVATAAVESPPR